MLTPNLENEDSCLILPDCLVSHFTQFQQHLFSKVKVIVELKQLISLLQGLAPYFSGSSEQGGLPAGSSLTYPPQNSFLNVQHTLPGLPGNIQPAAEGVPGQVLWQQMGGQPGVESGRPTCKKEAALGLPGLRHAATLPSWK